MQWVVVLMALTGMVVGVRRWARMIQQRAYDETQTEASLEKLRFLQRLDHELKNPLTAMQIALANLEETSDANRRQEIHTSMRGQLLRMSFLIGDLRKLAALGKGEIERIAVDVGDLLTETTATFADHPDVVLRHFTADFDPDALPTLTGDRDLLQLAIHNLLDNARKFTDPGDRILLQADTEYDQLVIKVTDTGRGIPAADLPHVWEDLYRSADVQGIPGSGVGLAMVKGIVEQHGGNVTASSVFGDATTMTVMIPIT